MADYFLDDASNATNDGASWATCYNTWAQVASAGILTASNRLFVGADANITDPGAALTITGPTSGTPAPIISSTVGSGTTVSYAVGTGKQIDTDSGAYAVTFDGSFALYGIRVVSGAAINLTADANEQMFTSGCKFLPAAGAQIAIGTSSTASSLHKNITIDLSQDTGSTGTDVVTWTGGYIEITGLTISNGSNRTGQLFGQCPAGLAVVSGIDMTSCTGSGFDLLDARTGAVFISNVITDATWSAISVVTDQGGFYSITNIGPADAPTALYIGNYLGSIVSSAAIYRTGGASVEGEATAWLVATTASCAEGAPYHTPWVYGVTTAGSKTFGAYITNDTADFTDAEVWLEVQYLSTEDEAIWALATDQRATIITTAAAQTDDTTSVWVGLNNSGQGLADYMQKLSITATVGEAGQYRARVAVGVASIAGSRYFYIDPKVTVS